MADVVLNDEALKELAATVKRIVHLMAEIDNAKEDIGEQCDQLKEKVDIGKGEVKRIAKAVYDESFLDSEKKRIEDLEDMIEALKGKL